MSDSEKFKKCLNFIHDMTYDSLEKDEHGDPDVDSIDDCGQNYVDSVRILSWMIINKKG